MATRQLCSASVAIVTLDKVDPFEHLTEIPCPDETCDGICVFLEGGHFFRNQVEERADLGPIDLGFEADAWQCQVCHIYLVLPETLQEMLTTTLEAELAKE